jgi:hypothetical protein
MPIHRSTSRARRPTCPAATARPRRSTCAAGPATWRCRCPARRGPTRPPARRCCAWRVRSAVTGRSSTVVGNGIECEPCLRLGRNEGAALCGTNDPRSAGGAASDRVRDAGDHAQARDRSSPGSMRLQYDVFVLARSAAASCVRRSAQRRARTFQANVGSGSTVTPSRRSCPAPRARPWVRPRGDV